ncbi:hypothetical protein Q9Q71_08180 [Campylobacter upsaliensis]|uniref:hypothetical protein n=1 Tax=Campylobacter upsaliensis TaxID=28080 RepID=UPI0022EAB287|nr:hypothetical protein [Campylobacter upsaliensis]MEB2806269.1 hypothetical protein [Campylobacter upsaliensis]
MMILKSSLKRSKFNSNTLRLINDFMQNLDAFNADKKNEARGFKGAKGGFEGH